LSLADHVLCLGTRSVIEAFPVGTILNAVKVLRVDAQRGLVVEVQSGLEGFVHVGLISSGISSCQHNVTDFSCL
jgi:rRNA biogenesis protein RRP5